MPWSICLNIFKITYNFKLNIHLYFLQCEYLNDLSLFIYQYSHTFQPSILLNLLIALSLQAYYCSYSHYLMIFQLITRCLCLFFLFLQYYAQSIFLTLKFACRMYSESFLLSLCFSEAYLSLILTLLLFNFMNWSLSIRSNH